MKILALDVGGTAIKSAIIDDSYNLSEIRTTPSLANDAVSRVERTIAVAKEYTDYDVLAVSMTGQIDDKKKTILYRNRDEAGNLIPPLKAGEMITEAIKKPNFILNDCNAAALGEATLGAGKDYKDFLCLTYGTGVGGAIIQDGQLLTGACGIAGEMGHMITHKGGRLCTCGHRGCYEQYASSTALLRNARKRIPDLQNVKQLFELAEKDKSLFSIIRAWEKEIVVGLLSLTYIFNPECIVLGGGVMEQDIVRDAVSEAFHKEAMVTFANVNITSAKLGNKAGMLGAAVYAKACMEKK